jgi:LuxR family maltose regulon positive regulatory protein
LTDWANRYPYRNSDGFIDAASIEIPYMKVFDFTTYVYHQFHLNRLYGLDSIIQALFDTAATQNRTGDLIESLLLRALLAHKTGDDTSCLSLVREAMMMGMKEDYFLPFYELKSEFAAVYKTLSTDPTVSEFVRKLISRVILPELHSTDRTKECANQKLIEPLTTRELEVLNLIVSGLSNQDICKQLFLALSTVKGYNQSIFEKLQVSRRTEAVAKARELGIV